MDIDLNDLGSNFKFKVIPTYDKFNDPSFNNMLDVILEIMNNEKVKEHLNKFEEKNSVFDIRENIKTALKDIVVFSNWDSPDFKDKFKKMNMESKYAFLLSSFERIAHYDYEINDVQYQIGYWYKAMTYKNILNIVKEKKCKSFFNVRIDEEMDSQSAYKFVLEVAAPYILPFSVHINESIINQIDYKIEENEQPKMLEDIKFNNYFALPIEINKKFYTKMRKEYEKLKRINTNLNFEDVIIGRNK